MFCFVNSNLNTTFCNLPAGSARQPVIFWCFRFGLGPFFSLIKHSQLLPDLGVIIGFASITMRDSLHLVLHHVGGRFPIECGEIEETKLHVTKGVGVPEPFTLSTIE